MKDNIMNSLLKTSLSASLLALSASLPVLAADINQGDPTATNYVAPEKANWSGLWVGAVGGYQFSNSALDFDAKEVQGDDGSKTVPLGGTEKALGVSIDGLGAEGLFGEVQIGFDQQIQQRFVVGVFGGLNINDAEFSVDASAFNAWSDPQSESATLLSFEQEWGGVLGARIGVLKSPDTLFYVAGGWAFGELGDVKSDGKPVFEKQDTDLNGWFGEVGMETRVYNNVFLTVSGRYTDYSAVTLDSFSGPCDGNDTCSAKLELDHDTLAAMVGLKVKLNGGLGF